VQAVRRVAIYLALGLLCTVPNPFAVAQDPSLADADPESGLALRGAVIPTGFQGRKYSAMIQIALDGSPLPNATWDLGASFIPEDRQPEHFTGRVQVEEPGVPVVFEVQVEFEPGPYALTLAAHETTAGQRGTRKLEGLWPDPDEKLATVSPVVLLQPAQGAFVRGGNARGQGALALGDDDPVKTALPTAVVSVVCRGAALADPIRVRRSLRGKSSRDFETLRLPPGEDRCAQVRDIIPAGTLIEGYFRYEMQLLNESGEIASVVREFAAGRAPGSGPGS
jgi:hypothetical protein